MRLTAMPRSFPRSPHLLLALVVVVWAGAFAAIKQLLHDGLAAPDIALGRYLVAAPGFAAALVMTRGCRARAGATCCGSSRRACWSWTSITCRSTRASA